MKIGNRLKMERCWITYMFQWSNQLQKLSAIHVTKWVIISINVFVTKLLDMQNVGNVKALAITFPNLMQEMAFELTF